MVGGEHLLDTLTDRGHLGFVQRAFPVLRGQPGGQQQLILLTGRHVEGSGKAQHHGPTGGRSSRFDEADVTRGHVGIDRQVELTEAAALPPVA